MLTFRQRWSQLPRDSRDTLFLLGTVAWIILPLSAHVPLWTTAVAAAALLWRGSLAWRGQPLPTRAWLLGWLALSIGGTLLSHKTLLGRDAGVTLIVMLLALKTLEMRARRDAFVVFFLGFFTMLTNFLYSQSLLTAAAMMLGLQALLTALVNAHMPVGKPALREAAGVATRMMVLGTPVMAALFILFPRLPPLWGVPEDAMRGRTGLSEQMEVGRFSELAMDDSIALRLRFESPAQTPPPLAALYFRGPVLTHFDGRQWLPQHALTGSRARSQPEFQGRGAAIAYEVTLEPNKNPWLILLEATDQPPQAPGLVSAVTSDLQWITPRPVSEMLRYRASSHIDFSLGPLTADASLQAFTQLPTGYNPRTLQWARELRQDPRWAQADTASLVQMALDHLGRGGYTYTLEPGVYGQHTADEFWFDRKEGFCEHIASAFVVLMRSLHVPARVVTGYQGGSPNPVDGYWVVRQSDAHAWAEVWQEGRGWVRVDPTAAVAPARVGSQQRLQPPRNALAQAVLTMSPGTVARLRATWEALNNQWNQWILSHNRTRQFELLKQLGFESPDWQDLGLVLALLISAGAMGSAAWTLWERRQHDPWLRQLQQLRSALRARGLSVPEHASPRTLATLVLEAYGPDAQGIHQHLLTLEMQRYGQLDPDRATPPPPRVLVRQIRQLRRLS